MVEVQKKVKRWLEYLEQVKRGVLIGMVFLTMAPVAGCDVLGEVLEELAELGVLPDATNNLPSQLLVLGVDTSSGNPRVFVASSGGSGDARDSDELIDDMVVTVDDGEEERELDQGTDYTGERIGDGSEEIFSFSVVVDYSGSMAQGDLYNASAMFGAIYENMPAVYESDIIYFSEDVTIRQNYTTDSSLLLDKIAVDTNYERSSTSLLDAMGTSLDRLKERDNPVKVAFVLSDGLENSSEDYTEKQISNKAKNNDIVLVMIGFSLADVPFLMDIADDSDGLFIYTPDSESLIGLFGKVVGMMDQSIAVEFNSGVSAGDEVTLEIGGSTTSFTL